MRSVAGTSTGSRSCSFTASRGSTIDNVDVHGIFKPKAMTAAMIDALFAAIRAQPPPGRDWGFARFILGTIVLPTAVAVGVPVLAAAFGSSSMGWFLGAGLLLLIGGIFGTMGIWMGGFERNEIGELVAQIPVGRVGDRAAGELVMVRGKVAPAERGSFVGDVSAEARLWTELTLNVSGANAPSPAGGPQSRQMERQRVVPFTVEDGDSLVLVDATDGLLRDPIHVTRADSRGSSAKVVLALAEREGLSVGGDARVDVVERGLAPGDEVLVLGVVRRDGPYRGPACLACGPADRLMVTRETRAALIASFASRDGRVMAVAGIVIWLAGAALAIFCWLA
jgi:hypothetical protein